MGESALLLVRMLASLVVVGLLLWALARVARSRGFTALGRGPIDIQAQRALNRSASLVLVKVGRRQLLLGVGDHGVQVLAEGDELAAGLLDAVPGAEAGRGADVAVDITEPADVPKPATASARFGAFARFGAAGRSPASAGSGRGQPGLLESLRERTVRRGAG